MALLLAVCAAPAHQAFAPQPPPGVKPVKGFERFQEWARFVWAHTPGERDGALIAVSAWSSADLTKARIDLEAIVTLVNGDQNPAATIRYSDTGVTPTTRMGRPSGLRSIRFVDVPDLIALPRDSLENRRSSASTTFFLKRAAMFHADIVMLLPAGVGGARTPGAGSRDATLRIVDGQDTGIEFNPIHWELGRTALDGVRPVPATDSMVAAWYRTTSAYMAFRREYGYLGPHLEKGRELFPTDAYLQLYTGVLHEGYAVPEVQVAMQSFSSRSFRSVVRKAADELRLAESFFRRALDLDPGLAIARLHLGRALGLLERHDQAVIELHRALSSLTDSRQRYYAELFLGAAQRSIGRLDLAQGAFERASALFPRAQSPYLALSELAWQSADRARAQVAFERLAALPPAQAAREDPWWSYEVSTVLDVTDLVDKLRQLAAEDWRK